MAKKQKVGFKFDLKLSPNSEFYLGVMSNLVRSGLASGVEESMKVSQEAVKKSFGTPGKPKVKSGNLRDSIRGDFQSGKNPGFTLSSDEVYAGIQEMGGTIRAKSGKYLTFQIGGSWVKVPSVTIPARPYLNPAVMENLKKFKTIITESVIKELD
jgi:phage gpG-like protein